MKLPRVIAAHDLSGLGKSSLTIALPVISACGAEVCPLPTAVLSAHTDFSDYVMFDLTDYLDSYLASWQKTGEAFDALYSGFLGSTRQIEQIEACIRMFSPKWIIVDPVMGDHGRLYATYTPKMCTQLRRLVAKAHIVTPNLTEACILTDTPYSSFQPAYQNTKALCEKIAEMGAKNVVITGIERENMLYNCLLDDGKYQEFPSPLLPYHLPGTGDLFASVLTGSFLTGVSLQKAVQIAGDFVYRTMVQSSGEHILCFENLLYMLCTGKEERL